MQVPALKQCSRQTTRIGKADYEGTGGPKRGSEPMQKLYGPRFVLDHARTNDGVKRFSLGFQWTGFAKLEFDIQIIEALLACHRNHFRRWVNAENAKTPLRKQSGNPSRAAAII